MRPRRTRDGHPETFVIGDVNVVMHFDKGGFVKRGDHTPINEVWAVPTGSNFGVPNQMTTVDL